MRRKLLIIICLYISIVVSSAVSFPDLRFKHYTVENGMSSNTVYSIAQDSKGFIWLATSNGLNRFDGKMFKVFLPNDDKLHQMSSNSINCFVQAADERIWSGTDFGVAVFNPVNESFAYFTKTTKKGVKIQSIINTIIKDRDDNVWIGTFGQGIFRYNQKTDELTQYTRNVNRKSGLSSNKINRMYEDSRGTIWVLTYDNGICSFDKSRQEFRFKAPCTGKESDRFDVMFEDSKGELWVGCYTSGVSKFDFRTGKLLPMYGQNDTNRILHVRGIDEYSPGMLLFVSDDGLSFFDTNTGLGKTVKLDVNNQQGLNDNYAHSVFVDKEGGMWVGTYFGGVNYSSPSYNNFRLFNNQFGETGFPGRVVSVMCEDNKANLWIGTDDSGLIYFDVKSKRFKHFMPQKGGNSIAYHNIHALLFDNNKLWIGTYSRGLDCLDIPSGKFKHYNYSQLPHPSIYALYKDKNGVIWMGTPVGLAKYIKESDSFELIKETNGSDVRCIIEDEKGYMWAASQTNGLFKLNKSTLKWKHYNFSAKNKNSISSDAVITLNVDKEQNLWIGTSGGGLCKYIYEKDEFKAYDKNGFPKNSTINKIISDNGYLWISTNIGLIRYQPDESIMKIYTQSDGLQSSLFCPNSGLKASDGTIYFGGINGFNGFKPKSLLQNTVLPNVVFTDFKLFNQSVSCNDENSCLSKSVLYVQNIVVKHSQSMLEFEFVALSYMAPDKNKYKYMLEGFDRSWIMSNGIAKATYTNLPAGDYVFRVKASNNDELWNETGASVHLTVLPPFWRSGIMIFMYIVLIIASGVYLLRMYRSKQELKYKESLQKINLEKDQELLDAKMDFFTQIIHEIRTPLTLIMGHLDFVLKSNKRVKEVKEDLFVVQRNSNRLYNLVNQFMDYRKIEVGSMTVKYENIDVNQLVTQIYECYKFTAQNKQINLSLSLLPEPLIISSDNEALTKILNNFLSNALKFTKDLIEIDLEISTQNKLQISIRDNGKGVPEEERVKIFKPFYQIKGTQSADNIGTGIGLMLCDSLVKLLNAEIVLTDSVGGGATFTLVIPIATTEEFGDKEIETDGEPVLVEPDVNELDSSDDKPTTILIIDDNNDILQLVLKCLDPYYPVLCASNAEEALTILKNNTVSLIVSDVMMPGMNGFEFCSIVKSDIETCHLPVVLLTAKTNIEAKIEGLETGADVYIEKPFSLDYLLAQVNSLLKNREILLKRFASSPSVQSFSLAVNKLDAAFLKKVDEYILKNMAETEFSIGDMASEIGMSRSLYFSKFRGLTGQTPNNYLRLTRLKEAAKLLQNGETRINEICYIVGFNSPSYFAKCFFQQFGTLPSDYVKSIQNIEK